MQIPCHACDRRTPACHDRCMAYLKYRAKMDVIKKKRNEEQEIENYFLAARVQRKKVALLMKKP